MENLGSQPSPLISESQQSNLFNHHPCLRYPGLKLVKNFLSISMALFPILGKTFILYKCSQYLHSSNIPTGLFWMVSDLGTRRQHLVAMCLGSEDAAGEFSHHSQVPSNPKVFPCTPFSNSLFSVPKPLLTTSGHPWLQIREEMPWDEEFSSVHSEY